MQQKKNFLKTYLITGAISLAVGAGIFCLFFFLGNMTLYSACNGTGYAGVILAVIGAFLFVCRCGFFDFVSYGFKQLGTSMFNPDPNKYRDYPGYREEKRISREKRSKYYFVILIVAAVFILACVALVIAFNVINS